MCLLQAHRSEDDFENGVHLGNFEYNSNGPWRQRFQIESEVHNQVLIVLKIEFNGNPTVCLSELVVL